jgi:hypothetical protein
VATLSELYDAGLFPRTQAFADQLAAATKAEFEKELGSATPSWWGRQALSTRPGGGGGIQIRRIPGGHEVHYADKGAYNYLAVIERGRGRVSIKDALLRSPRAKTGKHGRYIAVPLRRNKDGSRVSAKNNTASTTLIKSGFFDDSEGQKRTKLRPVGIPGGQGNATAFAQPTKSGVRRSFVRLVTVTERSTGWMHPAIPAQPIQPVLQRKVEEALRSDHFRKRIEADVQDFLQSVLGRKL